MNAHEYILSKQIQWAHNNNIKLIGSKKKPRPTSLYPKSNVLQVVEE